MTIRLWCRFRSQGVQWPLRPGDEVEIRDESGMDTIGVLAAELLVDLLAHYLYGARLQRIVGDQMTGPGRKPLRKANVAPLALQASRRTARRRPKKVLIWWLSLLALTACSRPPEWFYHDGATRYGPFESREACDSMRAWSLTQAYSVSPCFSPAGRDPEGAAAK